MWLLRHFPTVSGVALRTYYRFERAGAGVPRDGPVLLVANHPNSLLDPAAVCAVAERPVRFLAKAPLFDDPVVGWIMRACGAIPVYRRQDDPTAMDRNEDAFRAAHAALAGGHAVGIFPEGMSHSEPSLAPLKTGAARIALGAAAMRGAAFPIVPVGLVLRRKERFRSRALPRDRAERVRRLGQVSEALGRLRRRDPERLEPTYRAIARYATILRLAELRLGGLDHDPSRAAALRWTLRQLVFFAVLAPLAGAGMVLFWVPYRLTAMLPERAGAAKDVQSTWKVLGGIAVYGVWLGLLAAGAAWLAGPWAAVAVAAGAPVLALLTLAVRDRWEETRTSARAWWLLRRKGDLRRRLLEWRRILADRLEELRGELEGDRPR